jgi:hypothetical protein
LVLENLGLWTVGSEGSDLRLSTDAINKPRIRGEGCNTNARGIIVVIVRSIINLERCCLITTRKGDCSGSRLRDGPAESDNDIAGCRVGIDKSPQFHAAVLGGLILAFDDG